MKDKTKATNKNSNFWTSAGVSPSSGTRLGAGVSLRLLPPLALFAMLFGAFFSQNAYAASYINVSSGSGGTVSLGSIKPSSTGVSASGSDTLTIHTDCATGYSVYVSAQSDGDTNLTNTNKSITSNNVISASSTPVGSTATALSLNTWGINSENNNTYVGLPTFSEALSNALTTKSNVAEETIVPIYYGVKVDTSLSPGTYAGNVLYTVIMDTSCIPYTVIFNSNGGTGTMSNQSIMTGTPTNLTQNSFTRSGYVFLGWSISANGKTGTAVNGIGTSADVDYEDKESVTNLTTGGTSITLYAIWEEDVATMQAWAADNGCAKLSTNQYLTLKDARDNEKYVVKKLADEKCWMINNLVLGGKTDEYPNGLLLTNKDTNLTTISEFYLPPAGKQGNSSSSLSNASFDANNDNQAKVQYKNKGDVIGSASIEENTGYYNFYTATAGYSYRGISGSGDGISQGSSQNDICPKGWRLPKTTDGGATISSVGIDNDFTYLALGYGTTGWSGSPTGTNAHGYHATSSSTEVYAGMYSGNPLDTSHDYSGFNYTGYYQGATLNEVGSRGDYWTSSIYSANHGYYLSLRSLDIYSQAGNYKNQGAAIRCIAQSSYTINYSNSGATSGNPSKTTEGTVLENDGITLSSVGSMVKTNYEFKGWALTSGATSAAYTAEETVSLSALLTAASSAGQTTTPGSTITLYPVWNFAGRVCSSSVHPGTTDATACQLADGNMWVFGNSGNTATWNDLCTSNDNCKSTTYCPSSDYKLPTKAIYDALISTQGSGSQLYSALGLAKEHYFLSTTQYIGNNVYSLGVFSSSASVYYGYGKTTWLYVLCYKPSS